MSAIGSSVGRGAITGSLVGGGVGLFLAPVVGCAQFGFELGIAMYQKKTVKNKDSLLDNPFVITPLFGGAIGAAIGAIVGAGSYYFSS